MITVERNRKLNIQITIDPFWVFVLTSVLIHVVGLLMLVLYNRSLPTTRQETKPTPIDFVLVPPEKSPEKPPPNTKRRAVNNSVAKGKVEPKLPSATNKIGNEEAIATSKPSQGTRSNRQKATSVPVVPKTPPPPRVQPNLRSKPKAVKPPTPPPKKTKPIPPVSPVKPPTSQPKVPKPAIAPATPTPAPKKVKPIPPLVSKPQPIEKTPLPSESSSTAIPRPKPAPLREEKPPRKVETATPKVATNLPPRPKPIKPSSPSNQSPPTPSPGKKTPAGSASLLGGSYSRSVSEDSGSSFFRPRASASQQAMNSRGLDAREDLDLGPYFAEIKRRVKRNWRPSVPSNNRNTILVFSIQRNGQITGLRVIRSSGSPKVDRESLEAVQKSAPFPPLPQNFPNEQLNIEFNFNIYVNQGVFRPQLENWRRF